MKNDQKNLTGNSAPWIKPVQTGFKSVNSDSLSETIGKFHGDQSILTPNKHLLIKIKWLESNFCKKSHGQEIFEFSLILFKIKINWLNIL